jgi:(p)ppGpp synthase/HD superfamily hydrolase
MKIEIKLPDLIQLSVTIASAAHRSQKRNRTEEPYIMHPMAVAMMVPDRLKPLAILHDVMEDNVAYDEERLRTLLPDELVDKLLLLTKKPDEPYLDFILRAASDPDTLEVKLKDIEHNSSDLPPGSLLDKYTLAKYILEGIKAKGAQ